MWVFIYPSPFFRMDNCTLPYQESLRVNVSRFFLILTGNVKRKTLCILKYFNSFIIILYIATSLLHNDCSLHWQNLKSDCSLFFLKKKIRLIYLKLNVLPKMEQYLSCITENGTTSIMY